MPAKHFLNTETDDATLLSALEGNFILDSSDTNDSYNDINADIMGDDNEEDNEDLYEKKKKRKKYNKNGAGMHGLGYAVFGITPNGLIDTPSGVDIDAGGNGGGEMGGDGGGADESVIKEWSPEENDTYFDYSTWQRMAKEAGATNFKNIEGETTLQLAYNDAGEEVGQWDKMMQEGSIYKEPQVSHGMDETLNENFGSKDAAAVSKVIGKKVKFDDYDANDRPIFLTGKEDDDMEYTIDKKGNVWSHDGFKNKKIGSISTKK